MATPGPKTSRWTFLTNHARVLLMIANDPEVRLRDVAAAAGITERAAQAIVTDLEAAGYLTRRRVGRRNCYTIDPTGRFRHPAEAAHAISDLLAVFKHREAAVDAVVRDGEGGGGGGMVAAPRVGAETMADDPSYGVAQPPEARYVDSAWRDRRALAGPESRIPPEVDRQ